MTLFFYILIGFITFLAFLHAYFKKSFNVSRTIVVNRPKSEVYAFVRQLKKQPLWLPWFRKDTKAEIKFRGEDGYENAMLYWKGNANVGEGTQKIIKIREGSVVETKLFLVRPFKLLGLSYIAVKEIEPEKTKMVWGIRGKHKFPGSLITIFYSTERMFGKGFEKGLQNIKKELEKD